jgi:hypothetical protein
MPTLQWRREAEVSLKAEDIPILINAIDDPTVQVQRVFSIETIRAALLLKEQKENAPLTDLDYPPVGKFSEANGNPMHLGALSTKYIAEMCKPKYRWIKERHPKYYAYLQKANRAA